MAKGVAARCVLVVALLSLICGPAASSPNPQEIALGNQVYAEMVSHNYLLPNSPEARLLAPVAKQLKAVGDPAYGAPFTFYVHRSLVPNAFVVYGPRVYVDRGLIRMADSREELAGVLCHEMSHALHRDGTNDDAKSQAYDNRTKALVAKAEKLTHGHLGGAISSFAQFGENFVWLHHSRSQEERADLAGADLCAKAGLNPWGLVWMFQKLERITGSGGLSWFSDHPNTKKRITALKQHFKQNPSVFSSFSSDEMTATPLWTGLVQAPTLKSEVADRDAEAGVWSGPWDFLSPDLR